ncbi:hypothetical protein 56301_32 [Lactococcus phage 56301]|uniref:DUF1642 domain-containing protein n=1 Tax=Lactococcus phage 56301 TaxID=2029666 RepID=A0A343JPP0_9CAUD|nr:hypothetical protein HYP32_gp32 [Lactococcus phage 56301]ASZ71463.1 hypothetical protein 56301_32 [Lactococcus phage 56301]
MTKFEEKKKEACEKASIKQFGNADGSRAMRYLLNELENAGLLKEQQALPVVPECVAEWIDKNISVAHNAELMIHNILICAIDNKNRYLFPLEVEKFVLKNPITFLNAVITDKYEVEKPQLFYLKHIDMSRRNSINDLYLKKYIHADLTETGEHRLSHAMSAKGMYPPKDYCAFTQQEIDSMQTGSYELVPVEEGK